MIFIIKYASWLKIELYVTYLREYSICIWEECIFCWCCVECSMSVKKLFKLSLFILIFCLDDQSLLKLSKWVFYYCCIVVYFSLYISQCLLYIFRYSAVEHIYIYIWYIFLWKWPFYHYVMTSFASCDSCDLKFILSNISMPTSVLLWLSFAWDIFFSFTFILHVQYTKSTYTKINCVSTH